jgi:hypothetical protein
MEKINELMIHLWYLNYDLSNYSTSQLYELSNQQNIPTKHFLAKLVTFMKSKNKTDDEINETLFCLKKEFEKINIKDYDHCGKTVLKQLDDPKIVNISQKIKTFVSKNKDDEGLKCHIGHPEIDEKLGRPHISWKKCCYKKCMKEFATPNELVYHLIKNDNFIPNFHKMHEKIINEKGLTPEYINANNITECPIILCNKNNKNPQSLINHFHDLGIPNFYKHESVTQSDIMTSLCVKNFNDGESEKICMYCEKPTETIFFPCDHKLLCMSCSIKYSHLMNACPICKENILSVHAFA